MPQEPALTLPKGTSVPDHIAIILDGNRRWARSKGLNTLEGHRRGFNAGMKVASAARELGVHTVTVWGFSTENWDRSKEEILYLMKLYGWMVDEVRKKAKKENIRFIHLGRKDRFPKKLIEYISQVEVETKDNTSHVFNVALDYGGRDEILRAVKRIVANRIYPDKIDEKLFASYLDTADQPYPFPDLLIRTSGEQRTSGFLPWQMTYAEFYWERDHLPDMTPEKLKEAILDYSRRRRRFGGNDTVDHFKFNPNVVAKLELDWRHALAIGEGEHFRDLVIRYVREHYGLSKELAVKAGSNLAEALIHGKKENWIEAKSALKGLYEVIRKTLNLAFEPDLVAGIEINLWRANGNAEKTENGLKIEETLRQLYAETFRVSDFQISKAAHLSALATAERDLAEKKAGREAEVHWKRAQWYTERFYKALKERIA